MGIKKLSVLIDNKIILDKLDLSVNQGQMIILMGPNGSGKSTLAQVIAGNPAYEVVGGDIIFDGQSLLPLSPDERARLGIFVSFQYPPEIPGVNVASYLRMIYNKRFNASDPSSDVGQNPKPMSPIKFRAFLKEKLEILDMKDEFLDRYLNEGFSGGEKKKMELLQMLVLEPRLIVLDEIDSGLDIDALKCVAKAINFLRQKNPQTSFVIITHHAKIADYINPDSVHIMKSGRIVQSGGLELIKQLEETGYKDFGEESTYSLQDWQD